MRKRSESTRGIEPVRLNDDENQIDANKVPFKQRIVLRLKRLLTSLRLFIYNKSTQTIFGTTSTSWLKISIYYLLFYICLALFYCGMVAVFGAIVSRGVPTYSDSSSEMAIDGVVHPALAFRPMPTIDANVITVNNNTASQIDMTSSLKNYRDFFLVQSDPSFIQECSPTLPASSLGSLKSCQFSWTDVVPNSLHPCSDENIFGWKKGQPCVLIKFNQIFDWMPAPGNIVPLVEKWTNSQVLDIDKVNQNIYITCNGVDSANSSSTGPMIFYSVLHPMGNPSYGGLPYYFFPYRNTPQHVQPFVLVQFLNLPMDQKLTIECRAWAPNIEQFTQGTTVRGMTTFVISRVSS